MAAYSDGGIENGENHGNVTVSVPYLSSFGTVKNITNNPIHIGGLVAYLGANAPIANSVNNGDIDYDITSIESLEVSCGTNRPRMGGIAGMAQGHDVQTNTMIYAALPEFYAILALVATFLI